MSSGRLQERLSSSTRRVAYLTLQSTQEGQAARSHVLEIVKGLERRQWVVSLYEPRYPAGRVGALRRAIEFARVQARLWASGRPSVLYVRGHFAAWPLVLLAKVTGVPVVIEVNGPYGDLFQAWPWTVRFAAFFKWSHRIQFAMATAIITVTEQLRQWVLEEVGKREVLVRVIPNGVDTELFNPFAAHQRPRVVDGPYVVFVGALAPWQGIGTLLAAAAHPTWPQDVRLVIVGDGAARTDVERAAQTMPHRIVYLGRQPYKAIPGLLANSLASLCPKTGPYDSTGLMPLKLFEGMACGVPVIVTDYPGMADVVRDGKCGIVVPRDDAESIARAVAYIAANPQERVEMGRRGRRLVEAHHSWDQRANDTSELLKTILGL